MGYGDGSLFRNERGTWTMFATIDGKRYKRTGKDRTAVKAKVAELRRQVATGEYESPAAKRAKITISEHLAEWLEHDMPAGSGERPLAPSSQDRHHQTAKHVDRLLGATNVVDLTVKDVKAAFVKLHTEGHSRASIVKVCNTLSLALQSAMGQEIVDRNVAANRKVVIPAAAARTEARNALGADGARTLLTHARTIRNGLAFALSLRLGLRPGEAWAIYWSDVTDDSINVVRGIARSGGKIYVRDGLKTDGARRTIGLPADLAAWMAEHRSVQKVERMAAPAWADDRLVFATPVGTPVDPSKARKILTDLCNDAGIASVRPNELRHSAATLLANEGATDEDLAQLLGHVDTRMVKRVYTVNRERHPVDVAARSTWAQSSL